MHDLAAATFTPYHADGSVNYGAVDAHAADLASHGVPFAFINGTTGDSMALREEERKLLAEAWVAARAKHGVKVINHVGSASAAEAAALAAHAQAVGCDAICAMAPTFFKPAGPRALAEWLAAVGRAAPALPLYYYNFPAITGVDIRPDHLLAEIEAIGVPTFRGMKFTDFNLWWFSNCVAGYAGKYDIAYGRDEAMLGGLALGALGSIGNAFCFNAGVYQRLRKAFFAGDLATARAEQARANSVINIMNDARFGGHGLSVSRAIFEMKGTVPLGPPTPPLPRLTDAQRAALKAELDRIKFFEWCD